MKTVHDFMKKKQAKQKISMLTCYDFTSAKILANTEIDCLLVGDSASMVMLGYHDTTAIKLEDIARMTKSVAQGAPNKFIIADLPFMSYRKSLAVTVEAVTQLVQSGAQAVKLEGAAGNLETIQHIVQSGVPVMGHLGLTPQFIHTLGGFRVQGKTQDAEAVLIEQAVQLAEAGCFAIVLECIPWQLADQVTQNLPVPTIGIGAGPKTDGQVLVFHDLLGLQTGFKPKFLKTYLEGAKLFAESINQYVKEVKSSEFPQLQHCYWREKSEVC